ncbi:hypothetical protein BBF96_13245 [Anoxybacter fermentans]|uniref:Uncharacterized protein n=1 Tax=Anoxybacter fermentans TaxID=1323375 RepID=A0A3Q9HS02_9FIRM|nr:hypothetical protein [Anoxybacter fermentans]AZR74281.1 hypothetical protein BBF96_13245 [Anoxybacter fermentans]
MSIITSKKKIENFFEKGFNDKCFCGWSYDLRLGNEVFITSEKEPFILTDENPFVVIKPGDFALLITEEEIKLDENHMAFISVKFTYKKRGLINISGFHVDPTYKGKIIFSVYNAGPNDIVLKKGQPVFMIFFQELKNNLGESYYRGEESCYKNIPVEMMTDIRGASASLSENASKIERLENTLKIYGGIAIAIIGALLSYIFANGSG